MLIYLGILFAFFLHGSCVIVKRVVLFSYLQHLTGDVLALDSETYLPKSMQNLTEGLIICGE